MVVLASPDELLRKVLLQPVPLPDANSSKTPSAWIVDDKNQPRPTYKAFSEGRGNISTASQKLCTDNRISHDDVAGDRSRYGLVSGDLDTVRLTRVGLAGEPLVEVWPSEHADDAAGKAHCDVASDEMEQIADKDSGAFRTKRKQLAKDLVNKQEWSWILQPPDHIVDGVVQRRGL